MTIWVTKKNDRVCKDCKHFTQHYVVNPERNWLFDKANVGHCTYPRLKDKEPYDTCKYFEEKEQ